MQTVKALLTESALRRLQIGAHFFCAEHGCETVYFDATGNVFGRPDIRVPVWEKEPTGRRTICYCFGENEADIRTEVDRDNRSTAPERILENMMAGRCACRIRNPRGVCCLEDIRSIVSAIERDALNRTSRPE